MKFVTFTNNMSVDLMQWVEKYSATQKLTRRIILERALTEFRKSVRQKEYAQSFKKAQKDGDMKTMTEEGLGDYLQQLNSFE